jgi:hypothetical protein
LENAKTLKIEYDAGRSVRASYNALTNTITLKEKGDFKENGFLHEVLHMASTKLGENGDFVSGLYIRKDGKDYLKGFNEGMTMVLEHRVLGACQIGYPFEYRVAYILDEILGRFTKLYFSGKFGEEEIDKIVTDTQKSYGDWFVPLCAKLDMYYYSVMTHGKTPTAFRVEMIFAIQNIVFDMFNKKAESLLRAGNTGFIKFAQHILRVMETEFFTVTSSKGKLLSWQEDIFKIAPEKELKEFQDKIDALKTSLTLGARN